MIITPKIRSNICINAHPIGCAKDVERQIAYVKSQKAKRNVKSVKEGGKGPKTVLVLGCSTGYGLASRISAAFEYGADTIGVSFEKEASQTRGGTPGWYNNKAFDKAATAEGLKSVTLNGDAYSNEMRQSVLDEINKMGKKIDLLVYSLASPVRTDPETKVMYKSVIKPQGKPFAGSALDIINETLVDVSAEPATEEEIANTVKVMGGEDWNLWIDFLLKAGVLAEGCCTLAYSYIGPELSHAIYRNGSIGAAKQNLEQTAVSLNTKLANAIKGSAFISENKGLVTRSSAVIPIISLYLAILFKVMKAKGIHEGCIEQMERMFAERLYTGDNSAMVTIPVDEEHRIRMDDWELRSDVQEEASKAMTLVAADNLNEYCDLKGYKHDFLNTNGFDVEGVDYNKDVEDMSSIE